MLDVVGRSQEGISFRTVRDPVCLELPDEEQHFAAGFIVTNDFSSARPASGQDSPRP